MHGYEIKKALADAGMSFWFALEDASIYSVLRTLAKRGYARELGLERVGSRPERRRYAITESGRGYYRDLLVDALATVALPVAPVDVALAARGDLAADVVAEALDARRAALARLGDMIERHRRAAPSGAIADRAHGLVQAEQQWLDRLDLTSIT